MSRLWRRSSDRVFGLRKMATAKPSTIRLATRAAMVGATAIEQVIRQSAIAICPLDSHVQTAAISSCGVYSKSLCRKGIATTTKQGRGKGKEEVSECGTEWRGRARGPGGGGVF
jgi:hypothetical protein